MTDAARPWDAMYPPGVSWRTPIATSTIPAQLDAAAAAHGDKTALEQNGVAVTYAELKRRVDRFAAGLLTRGLRRGEAVALFLPNSVHHPVAFYGVLRAGGRVVHLTPLDPPRSLSRKLADSGARIVVTTAPLTDVAAGLDGIDLLVGDGPVPPGATSCAAVDTDPPDTWPALAPGDVAVVQYTGGTTGVPKGALLTHANLTAAVSIYDAWFDGQGRGAGPGDRVICVLPLFHIYALTCILLRGLARGCEILLRTRFDPGAVLDDIERRQVTHFNGVPTMWIALLARPDIAGRDLSSLRAVSSGGASLPHEVREQFTRITGHKLSGGWGMTETSPAGTHIPAGHEPGPGEIGVPLPGIDMDVVALDDPRRVLAAGSVGEVRIRGPNVTAGYWNRPEENAAAFVGGWFLTGDVGFMAPDGVFTLVDRKKDMIISGGFNVYPRAIEDAMHEHPDVVEAAVIGVPDAYRGQAARAYAVLRPDAPVLTLDALRGFLADKLGRHEMPAQLETRPSLPHTPVGKLDKRALADEWAATNVKANTP